MISHRQGGRELFFALLRRLSTCSRPDAENRKAASHKESQLSGDRGSSALEKAVPGRVRRKSRRNPVVAILAWPEHPPAHDEHRHGTQSLTRCQRLAASLPKPSFGRSAGGCPEHGGQAT